MPFKEELFQRIWFFIFLVPRKTFIQTLILFKQIKKNDVLIYHKSHVITFFHNDKKIWPLDQSNSIHIVDLLIFNFQKFYLTILRLFCIYLTYCVEFKRANGDLLVLWQIIVIIVFITVALSPCLLNKHCLDNFE